MTFVDNVSAAIVPTNSDTVKIGYNQRFIISDPKRYPPLVYQISKIEDTQPLGLTTFKFTQETFDASHDNAELGICNYYSSQIEPIAQDQQADLKQPVTITYSGTKPEIKVGGNYKIFTPMFHNATTTVSKWTVSDENGDISDDTDNYIIEHEGELLKLRVSKNYYLIGKVLIIQCIGSDGSIAQVEIEIIG